MALPCGEPSWLVFGAGVSRSQESPPTGTLPDLTPKPSRQCALMGQSKHSENAAPNQGIPGPFQQMGTGGGPGGSMAPRGMGPPGMGRGMEPGGGRGAGRGRGMEGKRVRITKGFDKGKVVPYSQTDSFFTD